MNRLIATDRKQIPKVMYEKGLPIAKVKGRVRKRQGSREKSGGRRVGKKRGESKKSWGQRVGKREAGESRNKEHASEGKSESTRGGLRSASCVECWAGDSGWRGAQIRPLKSDLEENQYVLVDAEKQSMCQERF